MGERASGLGPKGKERTGLKAQGFARYWEQCITLRRKEDTFPKGPMMV